jgi:uncharacterized membrane protein YoaK (UPF0700 family)
VLSGVTGMLDAVSVLGMGNVFTATMTGNVVFLGLAAAGVPGFEAPRFLVALAAFFFGAAAGGRLGRALGKGGRRRWLVTAAVIEALLLSGAGLAAIGYDRATLSPATSLYALLALTAFAMGLRNATVRMLKVADLSTTVLTLTLTGFGSDSALAGGDGKGSWRRFGAVAAILAGAAAGAALILNVGLVPPLLIAAGVSLLATCLYALHPAAKAPAP